MFSKKKRKFNKSLYGGYRPYRNPSIFRANRIKEKKEFRLPKIPFKTLFYIAVSLAALYYLFFSGAFAIKDVIVEGNKMVPSDRVASYVPKDKNILFFKLVGTEKKILKENPEIKNIEIYRGLPNAVKVVVLEHECKMIWQTGDNSYLISTQGDVAKKIEPGETYDYPRVIDGKNIPVTPGSNLLSPSFVAFINNLNSQFFDVTNIKPKDFEINETTFDVTLHTEAGFYVKFNSLRSSAKQLDNLKRVLVAKRDQIHEYVDLRIDAGLIISKEINDGIMSQIFAFGDSITWGSWDPNGGWADLLKREIVKRLNSLTEEREIIFFNLGIPSNRTDQLVERFKFEVDQRFDEDNQEKYFIFSFGANDAAFKIKERIFRIVIDEYEANIRKIIGLARDYSNNIVFLNTAPVDETKTDGVLNKSKSRKNEYIDQYNNLLQRICKEQNVNLLDINTEFKKADYRSLLNVDGLHPNSDGHKIILNLVGDYLFNEKKILQ